MGLFIRTCYCINNHTDAVIPLMCINGSIVNTHIRQTAYQIQCACMQPPQKNLQIRPKESAVSPLGNKILAGKRISQLSIVCVRRSFNAMHAFRTVQLTPEIDHICPVHLFDLNNRQPLFSKHI